MVSSPELLMCDILPHHYNGGEHHFVCGAHLQEKLHSDGGDCLRVCCFFRRGSGSQNILLVIPYLWPNYKRRPDPTFPIRKQFHLLSSLTTENSNFYHKQHLQSFGKSPEKCTVHITQLLSWLHKSLHHK